MVDIFEDFPDIENEAESKDTSDIEKLISVALKGEHSKVELLRSFDAYAASRILRSANMKVSKTFKKQAKKVLKQYFTEVATAYSSMDTFKAYRTLAICANYYRDEASIIDDCLSEYRAYLDAGHLINAFLGGERAQEDLHDFRKK